MRTLVTLLAGVVALAGFRLYGDLEWFPSVFFSACAGLIAGAVLTSSGRASVARIGLNAGRGWPR